MRRLVASLLLTIAASAQQGEVTIKSYTKLVQVPVVVTDKGGKPVKGLTKRDFFLYENGKRVNIATFQSPDAAEPAVAGVAPAAVSAQAGVYTNSGAAAAATKPIVIIVIDAVNTPFLAQIQARRQLIKLLSESIEPGTQLSLMMITKSGLRVVHEYTTSSDVLIAALKRVSQGADTLGVPSAEADQSSQTVDSTSLSLPQYRTADQIFQDILVGGVEFQDLKRSTYGEMTLQSLRQIAQRFAGVPGRKSLLWAASNFPYVGDDRTSINSSDVTGRYVNTFERLNDANISVYPVDAAGLFPIFDIVPYNTGITNPATFRNFKATGGVLLQGNGDTSLGKINETPNPIDTMKTVADLTGGTAYYGTNDLAGMLRKAVADSSDSYMLGYYLAGGAEAKPGRRELRVAVAGHDYKVRSRTRVFVTRDSFSPREEIMAALKSPLPAANLPLTVKWDAKSPDSPFVVSLDPKSLELSEPAGHLDLTVVVEARTPEGKVLSQLDKTLTGNIAKLEEFRSHPFEYQDVLSKLAGPATVRFVVRDNNSGRLGSVIVELN